MLEIDADKRIAEYQQEIRQKIKDMYKMDEIPEEVEDYINSSAAEPAMAESATFDAMVELMTSGKYDYYVFDMMPHGHAVRFLGMADILDQWIAEDYGRKIEGRRIWRRCLSYGRQGKFSSRRSGSERVRIHYAEG